jgi:hypothetical protein
MHNTSKTRVLALPDGTLEVSADGLLSREEAAAFTHALLKERYDEPRLTADVVCAVNDLARRVGEANAGCRVIKVTIARNGEPYFGHAATKQVVATDSGVVELRFVPGGT